LGAVIELAALAGKFVCRTAVKVLVCDRVVNSPRVILQSGGSEFMTSSGYPACFLSLFFAFSFNGCQVAK
jgi:hypothetical protein